MKIFFASFMHGLRNIFIFMQSKINYIAVLLVAIFIFGSTGWITAFHYYRLATAVPLISNDVLAQQTLAQTTINAEWQTITVKRGDTLAKIFKHLHLSGQTLEQLVASAPPTTSLKKLKLNEKLQFLITSDQQLQEFIYPIDDQNNLTFTRTETGFSVNSAANNNSSTGNPNLTTAIQKQVTQNISQNIKIPPPTMNANNKYGYAIVQKSLYEAGIQAGLSRKQAMQLVTLFSQDTNLSRNIRRGDRLDVLSETTTGYILVAQLTHRQKIYQIFRFTDPKGTIDYYTQDGTNLHPPIVRAPLNYSHISSRFSWHRWQPILHFVRPHTGVDYAAAYGTPIKAAGDGHILFIGYENGYGKLIKIKHPGIFETFYGHMSRFASGLHMGSIVHQGQVIGYVGDTGLSTGSHLHFEIRENNVPHDPLTVALPTGSAIPSSSRNKFFMLTKQLLAQLDLHEAQTKVAANN